MNINSIVNEDKVEKLGFIIQLIAFTKQCIKGAYMPAYKIFGEFVEGKDAKKLSCSSNKMVNTNEIFDMIKKNSLIMEIMINYMNQNWLGYNKQTDNYIREKFGLMQEFSKLKHIYCLFEFVWEFIQLINTKISIKIEKQNLTTLENLKDFFDKSLDLLLSEQIEPLLEYEFTCSDKCIIRDFDENDPFIKIKKL